ncbi:MAG: hypothetical protein LBU27_02335 [Candidatus Peribacteria bacterium]|nr:hypothetical protein [Candidatus Peribacteria bacterium]
MGRENAEIQKKIEEVDKEIDDIKKEIDEPTDESKNLFTKNKKTNEDYKAQEDKIENFYTQSASKIKNQTNPQIAKTNYDKTYFK